MALQEEDAGGVLGKKEQAMAGPASLANSITPALGRQRIESTEVLGAWEQAEDMTTGLTVFFPSLLPYMPFLGGLSLTPVGIEIPHGRCWLLLLQSPFLGYVNILPQQQPASICCRSLG